ncbi:MAG: ATP-binding cassette domain-containing protein [Sphaerochaetaceae bacterium]
MMKWELRKVTKRYGDVLVLDQFSCFLVEGQVNILQGSSGGGKTTLLRLLMGLEEPDAGILPVWSSYRISVVFQEDRLCDNLSAFSNIKFVVGSHISDETIGQAFSSVGLPKDNSKPVRAYSGGMRRRVALVRALLASYDILLLDEPFKGLDRKTKERVIAYTLSMTKGKTVLLVTHDSHEAMQMHGENLINL